MKVPTKSSTDLTVVWEHSQGQDGTTVIDQIYEILLAEPIEENVDRSNLQ